MITSDALKAEIANDPKQLGLAALAAAGRDGDVAARLNATSGPGAESVTADNALPGGFVLSKNQFALAIAPALARLSSLSDASVAQRFRDILQGVSWSEFVDLTHPVVKQMLAAAQQASVLTADEATAMSTRVGSRAEVLWGAGTVVTSYQCSQAR